MSSTQPTRYRKRPVVINATRWFKNGDHPEDHVGELIEVPEGMGDNYARQEGAVVRYFRHPPVDAATGEITAGPESILLGQVPHEDAPGPFRRPGCSVVMNDHGWIDTLEGGHTVCPSDWIITGVQGEHYPCKPDIFEATYEPAEAT